MATASLPEAAAGQALLSHIPSPPAVSADPEIEFEAGPSTPRPPTSTPTPICAHCKLHPSKYTCPRCSFKSCSLPCSTTHKVLYNCSGVRDPVSYVPMNRYGWGTLMNDYTYLEGVGRKVGEVGGDIRKLKGGRGRKVRERGGARGGRGGRGRGGAGLGGRQGGKASGTDEEDESSSSDSSSDEDDSRSNEAPTSGDRRGQHDLAPNGLPVSRGHGLAPPGSKLEILQKQLALRDIKVDFLPEGMARRKMNQSFWNVKTKTAMLTIEFELHAPQRSITLSSDPNDSKPKSYTLLAHRNATNEALADVLEKQLALKEGQKHPDIPNWVRDSLIHRPRPSDEKQVEQPSPDLLFLLLKHSSQPAKPEYHSLDKSLTLDKCLRHKRFIEWPTIHVWLADEFEGTIVGAAPTSIQFPSKSKGRFGTPPPMKKQKLSEKAAKKVLTGLIGGYSSGSGDEEETDEDAEGEADGLINVMEYESDGEEEVAVVTARASIDPGTRADENEVLDWGDADEELEKEMEQDEETIQQLSRGIRGFADQLLKTQQSSKTAS
ncbi:hypothetical protein M407DRAFT_20070 [Tulasnella calospora MUT 4182]|uniref:HIT-type domain-containing protein n=1 Tax=Tulasnella calospora MUT 4182 TaxID=1051891 RepID=A0A0C3QQU7_9AGAM|nr:hypothetical protein M407DRAFT_20070 [Tulasnella calospora MUT 4182]